MGVGHANGWRGERWGGAGGWDREGKYARASRGGGKGWNDVTTEGEKVGEGLVGAFDVPQSKERIMRLILRCDGLETHRRTMRTLSMMNRTEMRSHSKTD